MDLAKYLDSTDLRPEATSADIEALCKEAAGLGCYAVCVNSVFVPLCKKVLAGSEVKIASVIGFPLGAMSTEAKVFETEYACREGASEIDMVISVGLLKEGKNEEVRKDIKAVTDKAAEYGAVVKVILETCKLTEEEIVLACRLSEEAGAAFVKTSTGFSTAGATVEHVALMRKSVSDSVKVKAAGGIRDKETALAMINAGADRIGCSKAKAILGL